MNTFFLIFALSLPNAHAWGRRGHQIVGETAAQLQGEPGLRYHSFDVGFYANVPDIIWKRPATFETERWQHYMDLDLFAPEFKAKPEIKAPFTLSRAEFAKAFPKVEPTWGGAFWRVRELFGRMMATAQKLSAKELDRKTRFDLQLKWLVTGGVMGHYIGDLGQPLHTTSNHDGEDTHQKGIHSFFEDACVDQLYPAITSKVMAHATAQWPAFTKTNAGVEPLDLTERLAADSASRIDRLLKIDRENQRANLARTCGKFEELLVQRMTASALVLAELIRRGRAGWTFDNDRFFMFAGEPEYIKPGETE